MVGIASRCICCDGDRLARSPAVLMPFVAKRVFGHEPLEIAAEWGIRDLKPGTAYTLCSSLQCQDCGALFLDYRFTDEQLGALYRGYRDEAYTRERAHYEPGYATVAAHYEGRATYIGDVEKWLSPRLPEGPKVLDWGGADGINTPFLGRNALVHVHDISAVKVLDGVQRIGREQLAQHTYDLVACSQVLEHVPNPLNLLREIIPALSPRTSLYLEVPHEALMHEHPGSLNLAPLKHHWHEHINFFTESSLCRLLERAGLQLIDVLDLSIDLGWRKATVMGVLAKLARQ